MVTYDSPFLNENDTLICWGDSLTSDRNSYVGFLAEALADKNIKVINAGRKGDKTPLALMRLESVLFKQKFDALSIFLGVNDAIIGRGRWADEPFIAPQTFHDNLVAHQHEIDHAGEVIAYQGQCTRYLTSGNNKENILAKTNFIRPEDVHLYEDLCDGMKLATRTNFNPMAIVHAYFNGKFRGNLLDLTEPAHSALFPGQIIANKLIPDDYTEFRLNCNKICENCNYCKEVQKKATITL